MRSEQQNGNKILYSIRDNFPRGKLFPGIHNAPVYSELRAPVRLLSSPGACRGSRLIPGLSVFSSVKSDRVCGCFRSLQHALDSIEHDVKFRIITLFHFFHLSAQLFIRGLHLAQLHESPHDGDVHFDRALTVQNAGEHGDTLLSEDVWAMPAAATALIFDIPDWNIKESSSDFSSRNMKSSGNLFRFRRTPLLRLAVVTP